VCPLHNLDDLEIGESVFADYFLGCIEKAIKGLAISLSLHSRWGGNKRLHVEHLKV
jgi:hypothetical protein